jgi:hypothetical protein
MGMDESFKQKVTKDRKKWKDVQMVENPSSPICVIRQIRVIRGEIAEHRSSSLLPVLCALLFKFQRLPKSKKDGRQPCGGAAIFV